MADTRWSSCSGIIIGDKAVIKARRPTCAEAETEMFRGRHVHLLGTNLTIVITAQNNTRIAPEIMGCSFDKYQSGEFIIYLSFSLEYTFNIRNPWCHLIKVGHIADSRFCCEVGGILMMYVTSAYK